MKRARRAVAARSSSSAPGAAVPRELLVELPATAGVIAVGEAAIDAEPRADGEACLLFARPAQVLVEQRHEPLAVPRQRALELRQQIEHMVGTQLEAGIPELLQKVAQLLGHLDVVGQHELACGLALCERRARHDRGRAQAHDERALGGRRRGHRADHAGGARDVRGGRLAPAQPGHQVEAELETGAHDLLPRLDQVAAGATLVDRHEHLVGARLEAEVDPGETGVDEECKVLRRAPRERAGAAVGRHPVDRRKTLAHPPDDRRQLRRLDRARIGVLQEDRACAAAQEE